MSDHAPQDREQYLKDWAVAAVAILCDEGYQGFIEEFYEAFPNGCLAKFMIQAYKEARLKETTNE